MSYDSAFKGLSDAIAACHARHAANPHFNPESLDHKEAALELMRDLKTATDEFARAIGPVFGVQEYASNSLEQLIDALDSDAYEIASRMPNPNDEHRLGKRQLL